MSKTIEKVGFIVKVAVPCSDRNEVRNFMDAVKPFPITTTEITAHKIERISELKRASSLDVVVSVVSSDESSEEE